MNFMRWSRPALGALGIVSGHCGPSPPVFCMKRPRHTSWRASPSETTASGAAFAEAVRESGVSLPHAALARLRTSLLSRIASATPHHLTSSRSVCPSCSRELSESAPEKRRDPRATCWIYGEPAAFQLLHVPRWCPHCVTTCSWQDKEGNARTVDRVTRYWCGFIEVPAGDDSRAYTKVVEAEFRHADFFLGSKTFGVTRDWMRRWRYRLLVHRSSFQGEAAIFHLMHGTRVLARARMNLSDTWVRHILWRRAQEAAPEVRDALRTDLLNLPIETLVARNWSWYEAMMLERRLQQLVISGDRQDILAIDGNAKLHRRTCGMPFCEVIYCPQLDKDLLRGCPRRPHGTGTLCGAHTLSMQSAGSAATDDVRSHRLRRALHSRDDYGHLEVKLEGCSDRWQPACTVEEGKLAAYFAKLADRRIRQRRLHRMQLRAGGVLAKRSRRETTFMASWSSAVPRANSACQTHKETPAHVVAAARTAGFLTAVSSSGVVVDLDELIGAESLSQRYRFLARVAERLPTLKVIVHDDACHLRLMVESQEKRTAIATRLAEDCSYIVDDYHSTGHVGQWCSENCMPKLEPNAALLDGFPTNICEIVNSELSPLGHTVHHMGRWTCQLYLQEVVDVLNMKTLQKKADQKRTAEKKTRRDAAAVEPE